MLKKYKLKAGTHIEDGVAFTKGEVIETYTPLDMLFEKERFEYLGVVEEVDEEAVEDVSQEEQEETDVEEAVSPVEEAEATEEEETAEEAMFVIDKQSSGWYNVVNSQTGEKLNDKRLRKKAAEALVESLSNG